MNFDLDFVMDVKNGREVNEEVLRYGLLIYHDFMMRTHYLIRQYHKVHIDEYDFIKEISDKFEDMYDDLDNFLINNGHDYECVIDEETEKSVEKHIDKYLEKIEKEKEDKRNFFYVHQELIMDEVLNVLKEREVLDNETLEYFSEEYQFTPKQFECLVENIMNYAEKHGKVFEKEGVFLHKNVYFIYKNKLFDIHTMYGQGILTAIILRDSLHDIKESKIIKYEDVEFVEPYSIIKKIDNNV